ncbi:nucleotide exchange factor GrpE [Candidatus Nitrosopelagicus sp.]|nr:nucleotide exchange factor GrpE [Candidatus Nitrosopelagicus sp.]
MSEDKESNIEEPFATEEFNEELKNAPLDQETKENIKRLDEGIMNLKKENSELKDKWQRALADYQNLERRTQVEISQRVSSKTNVLLLNFINIYEDFIRAVDVLSKDNVDTNGLQAIIKNMESLLHENNIKPIDAVGEIFDPQIHEAVSMIVDETLDEGTITQEVSKGYISGKAILKPSKVIVSKK